MLITTFQIYQSEKFNLKSGNKYFILFTVLYWCIFLLQKYVQIINRPCLLYIFIPSWSQLTGDYIYVIFALSGHKMG